ncbi:hypothetical protein GQ57_35870 [Burkholderia sp. MSh2]|uniref:GntR family transcriptional regulator n=1 Tax=Burkholderia paludis TaxID=1506587 RepID=A0A6P2KZU0_9BURK|nr:MULTISPECIES: GntR family transcriptional regulator [Burkholderia]KEZ01315.1 hypothetical protein GQ57_35870 [Burkholderia sp. MSh2]CAB3772648.1 hypothetical protein LMG30113_06781 [Burkholderia paludis]VWB63966.1 GntR family transcriptional regulator [Burkholderia paludis]
MKRQRGHSVDQVHQVLEERIVSGFYAPGLRLSQELLAEELNTSRTPLREAFNRLQANGLVVASNNRGVEVAPIRFEHTEQLYALRLLVEPPLIAALIPSVAPKDIQTMRAALESMRTHSYSTRAFQDAHLQFHQVLLSRYPEAMRVAVESAYQRIHRHQQLHFSRPHVPEDFTTIDQHFLDAIEAGNAELARKWNEFHLIDTALGLMLDIDPEQRLDSLQLSAAGVNIVLEQPATVPARPVRIRWNRPGTASMPAVETVNLIHAPEPPG